VQIQKATGAVFSRGSHLVIQPWPVGLPKLGSIR
jgi:hypothetical protein